MSVNRLEKDGKVAVLYSPEYGAGWSSWNDEPEFYGLIFDREIAEKVLAGDRDGAADVAERKYPGVLVLGARDLEVEWLPIGTRFEISEYDGYETVVVITHDYGFIA